MYRLLLNISPKILNFIWAFLKTYLTKYLCFPNMFLVCLFALLAYPEDWRGIGGLYIVISFLVLKCSFSESDIFLNCLTQVQWVIVQCQRHNLRVIIYTCEAKREKKKCKWEYAVRFTMEFKADLKQVHLQYLMRNVRKCFLLVQLRCFGHRLCF